MSERKEGWYWVKHTSQHPWECCFWQRDQWLGRGMYHEPYNVGPRIPSPDEPWQTVPVEPTADMLKAHDEVDEWLDSEQGSSYKLASSFDGAMGEPYYKAMLFAAPNPEDT